MIAIFLYRKSCGTGVRHFGKTTDLFFATSLGLSDFDSVIGEGPWLDSKTTDLFHLNLKQVLEIHLGKYGQRDQKEYLLMKIIVSD